jgi:Ca-activated chloride channel family protein
VDEATLEEIARRTGGRFFRATDADALEEVYREIDRLERTKITEERSRQYREYFRLPLGLGLLLASGGWLGRSSLFARLP